MGNKIILKHFLRIDVTKALGVAKENVALISERNSLTEIFG